MVVTGNYGLSGRGEARVELQNKYSAVITNSEGNFKENTSWFHMKDL